MKINSMSHFNIREMIKTVFTTAALTFAVLQATAAPFVITGKVLFPDRSAAEGAIVTLVAPEDASVPKQTDTVATDGSFKMQIGGSLGFTRLLNIIAQKPGYQPDTLKKVISSTFVLEDIILVPENTTIYKPYLNLIAQSDAGNNLVAWQRPKNMDIDYYVIKRKNAKGIFDSIGKVEYDAMYSTYEDTKEGIAQNQYYQIEAVFNDKKRSLPSNTRKTFELSFGRYSLDRSLLLDFSLSFFDGIDYPADEISTVTLLRSYNGSVFDTIASKQLSTITYITVDSLLPDDTLKRTGKYLYKMCVNYKDTVFPGVLKSDSGPFSQSMSNLAEAIILDSDIGADPVDPTVAPLRLFNDFGIARVYPVPAYGSFTVESEGTAQLVVSAITGETVLEIPFAKTVTVSDRRLIPGIYCISVICNGETKTFLQVIK